MSEVRTRVIQVRFTSEPDPRNHRAQIRLAAVILYPPEVKRQLRTLEAAAVRAAELARRIIQRRCYRLPDLDTLTLLRRGHDVRSETVSGGDMVPGRRYPGLYRRG